MRKGILTVVSGFSGVGKGTVVAKMKETHHFELSISCATRSPRNNEVDGVHYHFITQEEFDKRVEADYFLEYAQYTNNSYGTPKKPVLDALEEGFDVLLEIEAQGAMQIKEKYPEALLIYIMPPSFAEVKNRLVKRGTETEDKIQKRLMRALDEFKYIRGYDRIIVNEDVEVCAAAIINMINNERMTPSQFDTFLTRIEEEAHEVLGVEK